MYEASTGGSSPSVLVVKPMFLNNVSPRVVTLTLRDERERRDERREMAEKRQETRERRGERRETRGKRRERRGEREEAREKREGPSSTPNLHPSSPSSFSFVVAVFVVSCETHRAGKFM